ncbi:insulinase family protein [Sedimentibacter sp. zth1]|uniref:M16 family metallopeptidase n=1 Tax=Sedimentibacter sp. zth1 TaxID=2816908 RepID=UPI001A930322|nr:pitrilysin family protein [Sedimentibacter sp. zth1]QSX05402.1 insulinase family protein [Sedimentibacter sp. zth1]
MFNVLTSYLDNGLKILLKRIPEQKTISCGVWFNQGSKNEDSTNNGISHLAEHLMFKTKSKNSSLTMQEHIEELLSYGAQYNGATTKDYTCFYIDGLSKYFDKIIETLSYMVINKEEITDDILENEKLIVLREAESYLNSSSQIGERVGQALWGDYSYGQLTIGKIEIIKKITANMLNNLIRTAYVPENATIVIVGNLDYDNALDRIVEYFNKWSDNQSISTFKGVLENNPGIYVNNKFSGDRSTIGIGFSSYSAKDSRCRYVDILKNILVKPGSNLFREIREKRGLVYSLNGFTTSLSVIGYTGLAFSANNDLMCEIIKYIIDEISSLKNGNIAEEMLKKMKRIKETSLLYSLESTSAQLMTIGKSAICGSIFLLEEEVRELNKITVDDIRAVASDIFSTEKLCMAVLGNCDIDKIIPLLEF